MNRTVDWTPLVPDGHDPVPGDPDAVATLGSRYRLVAAAIAASADALRKLADSNDMQSSAVDAFRDKAREVAFHVSRAHDRYAAAGQALERYAPRLRDAQETSLAARQDAENARSRAATANAQVDTADRDIAASAPGADVSALQTYRYQSATAATSAAGDLDAARRRLASAIAIREEGARQAIAAIDQVDAVGNLEDNAWDQIVNVIEVVVAAADHVAAAAAVLALLVAWIPVIGQALAGILGTVALLAGLLSLIGNISLAATSNGEWGDVALAAVGTLTFGVGKAAVAVLGKSASAVRGVATARSTAASWGTSARLTNAPRAMSVNRARALGRATRWQRIRHFGTDMRRSYWKEVKGLPENLRTVATATGRAQARLQPSIDLASLTRRRDRVITRFMHTMSEGRGAQDVAALASAPAAVRASAEAAPVVGRVSFGTARYVVVGGYQVWDLGVQVTKVAEFWTEPDPAEELNLREFEAEKNVPEPGATSPAATR